MAEASEALIEEARSTTSLDDLLKLSEKSTRLALVEEEGGRRYAVEIAESLAQYRDERALDALGLMYATQYVGRPSTNFEVAYKISDEFVTKINPLSPKALTILISGLNSSNDLIRWASIRALGGVIYDLQGNNSDNARFIKLTANKAMIAVIRNADKNAPKDEEFDTNDYEELANNLEVFEPVLSDSRSMGMQAAVSKATAEIDRELEALEGVDFGDVEGMQSFDPHRVFKTSMRDMRYDDGAKWLGALEIDPISSETLELLKECVLGEYAVDDFLVCKAIELLEKCGSEEAPVILLEALDADFFDRGISPMDVRAHIVRVLGNHPSDAVRDKLVDVAHKQKHNPSVCKEVIISLDKVVRSLGEGQHGEASNEYWKVFGVLNHLKEHATSQELKDLAAETDRNLQKRFEISKESLEKKEAELLVSEFEEKVGLFNTGVSVLVIRKFADHTNDDGVWSTLESILAGDIPDKHSSLCISALEVIASSGRSDAVDAVMRACNYQIEGTPIKVAYNEQIALATISSLARIATPDSMDILIGFLRHDGRVNVCDAAARAIVDAAEKMNDKEQFERVEGALKHARDSDRSVSDTARMLLIRLHDFRMDAWAESDDSEHPYPKTEQEDETHPAISLQNKAKKNYPHQLMQQISDSDGAVREATASELVNLGNLFVIEHLIENMDVPGNNSGRVDPQLVLRVVAGLANNLVIAGRSIGVIEDDIETGLKRLALKGGKIPEHILSELLAIPHDAQLGVGRCTRYFEDELTSHVRALLQTSVEKPVRESHLATPPPPPEPVSETEPVSQPVPSEPSKPISKCSVPELTQMLKTASRSDQVKILEKMGKMNDPNVVSPLLDALENDGAEVRKAAAVGLGKKRKTDLDVFPGLNLLLEQRMDVALAAVKSLGAIGDGRAVKPLEKMLNHWDDSFSTTVRAALKKIEKRRNGNSPASTERKSTVPDSKDLIKAMREIEEAGRKTHGRGTKGARGKKRRRRR